MDEALKNVIAMLVDERAFHLEQAKGCLEEATDEKVVVVEKEWVNMKIQMSMAHSLIVIADLMLLNQLTDQEALVTSSGGPVKLRVVDER